MIDDLNHLTQASIGTHGFVSMGHCDTGVCLESTRNSNICLRIQATRACTWLAALELGLEPIRVAGNLLESTNSTKIYCDQKMYQDEDYYWELHMRRWDPS